MRITINGTLPRGVFAIDKPTLRRAASFFAAKSRGRVGDPTWHEIVVHLVHDDESDAAHRAIMDTPGATDVITQAYDAIPPEKPGLLGELVVNLDQAVRAAPRRNGWNPSRELLLYIAHGMDHLSGADDHSERDYRTMRRRELGWLREFAAAEAAD